MKRFLYILCVTVSLAGVSSCKKDADPVPDPVVGQWTLGRIRFSGYPAPFTSLNADRPSSAFDLSGSINIKNDKSFTETFNNGIQITDLKGNWEYSNNTLQLKYDTGDSEDYELDTTQDPIQLLSPAISQTDSLRASATSPIQAVPFRYQLIYTK